MPYRDIARMAGSRSRRAPGERSGPSGRPSPSPSRARARIAGTGRRDGLDRYGIVRSEIADHETRQDHPLHFVAQMPLAGIAWQALHYLLALERLGYEAWYVEDHGANPYDPRADSVTMDCRYNVAHLRRVMARYGFAERWSYWDAIRDVRHGLSRERVCALFAEADGLINLCGATRLREEHLACPIRILIDTDPVYEQIKYAQADPAARAYLEAHTHFFTYGENLGAADCPIPLSGLPWRPTRPPVDPTQWPEPEGAPSCFTTVATWENKGKNIEFAGERYHWSKHVNFLRFLDLPRHRPDRKS